MPSVDTVLLSRRDFPGLCPYRLLCDSQAAALSSNQSPSLRVSVSIGSFPCKSTIRQDYIHPNGTTLICLQVPRLCAQTKSHHRLRGCGLMCIFRETHFNKFLIWVDQCDVYYKKTLATLDEKGPNSGSSWGPHVHTYTPVGHFASAQQILLLSQTFLLTTGRSLFFSHVKHFCRLWMIFASHPLFLSHLPTLPCSLLHYIIY